MRIKTDESAGRQPNMVTIIMPRLGKVKINEKEWLSRRVLLEDLLLGIVSRYDYE